jgi:pimeloyl-ACP methyl ester carboxylesterase
VLDALALERDVIAVDLPGHGETPPLAGETSIATFADVVTRFLDAQGLGGVDAVGSSMGARLVLELARRASVGSVVSLDPGGFWQGWERTFFASSVALSGKLVRALDPVLPLVTGNPATRSLLLAQFSARPGALPAEVALTELRSIARSPSYDPLLHSLVHGPDQRGVARGDAPGRITVGWGREDRVCLPRQAARVLRAFPDARLHWFDQCGHFPQWDAPAETVRVILEGTGGG